MNQMNRKFKYDQYQIRTSFRNENSLVISAEFTPTQEIFQKDDVQLLRIKKDTVFATLERKSEKNLRCQLEQILIQGRKYLVITFIVNFDYLPEFREEIKLDFIQKKDKLQSISVNNFQDQIEELQKALNNFSSNGVIMHKQIATANQLSNGQDIWQHNVTRGKYLLRFSGIYTNSSGQVAAGDTISFSIKAPGSDDKKSVCTAHSQHGYSYPINFSELIDADDGQIKVHVKASAATCTLTTSHFTLSPVFEMA